MTIDQVMLPAVRHYLRGAITVAVKIHEEMQYFERSFDYIISKDGRTLGNELDNEKQEFLRDCREMLKDPIPVLYADREDYHLTLADRSFLTELCGKAEETDWMNPEEVDRLRSSIDAYAPHGGFSSGV